MKIVRNRTGEPRTIAALSAIVAFFVLAVSLPLSPAQAGCCNCGSVSNMHSDTRDEVNEHITEGFKSHRDDFILGEYWADTVRPGLMEMTEQLTATAFLQMEIIGTYFDAQLHLETQRLMQRLQARAHKDYMPSKALCQFGTAMKSLGDSQMRSRAQQIVISDYAMGRFLNKQGTIGARGSGGDIKARMDNFKTTYCNPRDNQNGLDLLCGSVDMSTARPNKDIDFIRTIDAPMTLELDMVNNASLHPDEEDVLALSRYLYGHDIPEPIDRAKLEVTNNQPFYLNLRSVQARRNVAHNSYSAIAAMKARGSGASAQYMHAMLQNLGLSPDKAKKMIGQNPSYYAQMEVLTKKLYQDPAFVVNLVDKPANVQRQQAALMSFELMQQRDIFDSLMRSEMLLSLLLEQEVSKKQEEVENNLGSLGQRAVPDL